MTAGQLYTFAIVSVLFIPCISTIAVLYRQLGARSCHPDIGVFGFSGFDDRSDYKPAHKMINRYYVVEYSRNEMN